MTDVSRREFVKTAATGTAAAWTALSRSRVLGANDRISIGQIGCGDRGIDTHMKTIHTFDADQNVAFTAVCDPWRVRREQAAGLIKEWYSLEAKQFASYEDLLALKEVDAVMIASPTSSTRGCWRRRPKPENTPIARSRWPGTWRS